MTPIRLFPLALAGSIVLSIPARAQTTTSDTGAFLQPTAQLSFGSNSGQLTIHNPLTLPPARGKYQPALSWDYLPGAHTGVYGWGFTLDFIEPDRVTLNNIGNPRDRFFLRLHGNQVTLVNNGSGQYQPEVVHGYVAARVAALGTADSCGSTYSYLKPPAYCATQWSVTDSVGNVYTFVGNIGGPWYVQKVVDTDGNPTVYEYNAGPDALGHQSLAFIRYNYYDPACNSAPTSAACSQSVSSLTTGFYATVIAITYSPLNYTQDPTNLSLAATVAVQSQDASPSASTTTPSLTTLYGYALNSSSVFQSGRTGAWSPSGGGPFTKVGYGVSNNALPAQPIPALSQADGGTNLISPNKLYGHCSYWTVFPVPTCQAWQIATWMDLDNDGRLDIVWGDQSGIAWARNITVPGGPLAFDKVALINGSQNWFSASNGSRPMGLSAFNPNGEEAMEWTDNANHKHTVTTRKMMDFDGDGRVDLVTLGGTAGCSVSVRFNRQAAGAPPVFQPDVCVDATPTLSSGHGWTAGTGSSGPPWTQYGTGLSNAIDYGVFSDLVDVNGDGVADLVILSGPGLDTSPSFMWHIFPGYFSGTGWKFGGPDLEFVVPAANVGWSPIRIKGSPLKDLNGDGLPDWLNYGTTTSNGSTVAWTPLYSCYDSKDTVSCGGYVQSNPFYIPVFDAAVYCSTIHSAYTACSNYVQVAYGNGGGFPQLINRPTAAGEHDWKDYPLWPKDWNTPGVSHYTDLTRFDPGQTVGQYPLPNNTATSGGGGISGYNSFWIDLDGDGMMDYVVADSSTGVWQVFRGQPGTKSKGSLVTQITNHLGGVTNVTYLPSSTFTGGPQPQQPIYPVVWEKTVTGPGIDSAHPSVTHFWYANPQMVTSIVLWRCLQRDPFPARAEIHLTVSATGASAARS